MIRENPYDWNLFTHDPVNIGDFPTATLAVLTLPAVVDCEIAQLSFDYLADGTVLDRFVFLGLNWTTPIFHLWHSELAVQAGQTRSFLGVQGGPNWTAFVNGRQLFSLPSRLRFRQGFDPFLDALNRRAGDRFLNVKITWNEWIAPI